MKKTRTTLSDNTMAKFIYGCLAALAIQSACLAVVTDELTQQVTLGTILITALTLVGSLSWKVLRTCQEMVRESKQTLADAEKMLADVQREGAEAVKAAEASAQQAQRELQKLQMEHQRYG